MKKKLREIFNFADKLQKNTLFTKLERLTLEVNDVTAALFNLAKDGFPKKSSTLRNIAAIRCSFLKKSEAIPTPPKIIFQSCTSTLRVYLFKNRNV